MKERAERSAYASDPLPNFFPSLNPLYSSPAFLRASRAVGSFIEFWGFKRIHGIIWLLLYLSPRPLSQQEIVTLTRFSKASVSLALREMAGWGVIHLLPPRKGRERFYEPETHLGTMVRNVLERREKVMLEEAHKSFVELVRVLRENAPRFPSLIRRAETLLVLTRTALFTVDEFLRHSRITIRGLRQFFLKDLR